MYCQQCGAENPDHATHCSRCGAFIRIVPNFTAVKSGHHTYKKVVQAKIQLLEGQRKGPVAPAILAVFGLCMIPFFIPLTVAILLIAGAWYYLRKNAAEELNEQISQLESENS